VLYFHVVFTLPHELSAIALQNKRVLYELLFRASGETLLEIAADPKHLGHTSDFLAFSTPGDRTCFIIRMSIVSFPPVVWHWTGPLGKGHAGRTFSFLSAYSVVYSEGRIGSYMRAAIRWARTRPALSCSLYPSHCNQQPPSVEL
jgi:hypothetical protein